MHGEKIHAYGIRILKGFRPFGPLAVHHECDSNERPPGYCIVENYNTTVLPQENNENTNMRTQCHNCFLTEFFN